MTHPDHREYLRFSGRSRLDKAINSLVGIIEGIAADGQVTAGEVSFLNLWLQENRGLRDRHPYNELMPVVEEAIRDGVLSEEEREDILYLCEKLRSTEYFDAVTADMQRLHGMLGGIMADGVVTEAELHGLSNWIADHEHLKSLWPYDEVESIVSAVLRDKKIDDEEQKMLQAFFSEFLALLDNRTITTPQVLEGLTLTGVCSMCPEISFDGKSFCFTGASNRLSRKQFNELVQNLGGTPSDGVTKKTDYLVIGAEGNPAWAYACYGRKVEKAVSLRKEGVRILLVHENDFHDAVADS
jgi:hypothetical protein